MTNRFNAIRQRQKAPGVCHSPPPPPECEISNCPSTLGPKLRWVAQAQVKYPTHTFEATRIVDCDEYLPGLYAGETIVPYEFGGFPFENKLKIRFDLGVALYCWRFTMEVEDDWPYLPMGVEQLGKEDEDFKFPPVIDFLYTWPYDGVLTAILLA